MTWFDILKNRFGFNPNVNFLEEAATELQKLDIRYFDGMKNKPNYYKEQVAEGKWGAEDLLDVLDVSMGTNKRMHERKAISDFELHIRTEYYTPIKEQLEHWNKLEGDKQ